MGGHRYVHILFNYSNFKSQHDFTTGHHHDAVCRRNTLKFSFVSLQGVIKSTFHEYDRKTPHSTPRELRLLARPSRFRRG